MSILQSSFPGPINGPVARNPSATHILICLHGFGSSGDDLISLAAPLKAALGNLAESNPISLIVYSPDAPAPTPMGQGFQWFRDAGWTFRDESGLQQATRHLNAFIGHVLAHHGLPAANLALLGFSQGAMAILHALPSLTPQPAAVIACSGALTITPAFPPNPNPPPILFLHGAEDDVLPADTSVQASQTFAAHGYPTTLEIIPNLGHGISPHTLAHISLFLQEIWAPQPL